MYLKYGTYTHDANEGAISITRPVKTNERGNTESVIERWEIDGTLQAASVAALTTAILALEAAYATDGNNVVLLDSDGVTETAHKITSANTTSGVRVVERPHYPVGTGGEYTTYRNYKIVLEAETQVAASGGQSNALVRYQETITFTGGGPKFGFMQTLQGRPQIQTLAEATPFRAVQSGSAIGKSSYPSPNTPVWPDAEQEEQRNISRKSPERSGQYFVNYEISWQYYFSSTSGFSGLPKVR